MSALAFALQLALALLFGAAIGAVLLAEILFGLGVFGGTSGTVSGLTDRGLAVVQVDLDVHRNRHQPLAALTPMAFAVLATIATRLQREGRLTDPEQAPVERPALASVVLG